MLMQCGKSIEESNLLLWDTQLADVHQTNVRVRATYSWFHKLAIYAKYFYFSKFDEPPCKAKLITDSVNFHKLILPEYNHGTNEAGLVKHAYHRLPS